MPAKITVHVIDYGRKSLVLRWTDPVTGKLKTKSSKTKKKSEAYEQAKDLAKFLNSKLPTNDGLIDWEHFVDEYDDHHLISLSRSSRARALGVLNVLKIEMDPSSLADVSSSVLSSYCTKLRKTRSESTIATHMRTLHAAFAWAVENGHIAEMPRFPKQARARRSRAKGRPLTDMEFVKLLRAVRLQPDLARLKRSDRRTWRRLLVGLWLSGLRLEEALVLTWGETGTHETALWIDTSGKYPLLGIVAESEKGKQDRLLPLTPDFGRWLLKVPLDQRVGYVFPLAKERHHNTRRMDTTSKTITDIGKASGVKVNADGKFASAHDLRRSFGLRWASRVMPAELQQLMRHDNVATTMSFYALVSAQDFAEKLWNEKST